MKAYVHIAMAFSEGKGGMRMLLAFLKVHFLRIRGSSFLLKVFISGLVYDFQVLFHSI